MHHPRLDLPGLGPPCTPPVGHLLKWVGNKARFVRHIAACLPDRFERYFEPFLGSGAMLASLAPDRGHGSDALAPLVSVFETVVASPDEVTGWYRDRWELIGEMGNEAAYEFVKDSYNAAPNAADLIFMSRACYGGVMRFRRDGVMSTPVGSHQPIQPDRFERRVADWSARLRGCRFECVDYREAMTRADRGDLVYCDPPYPTIAGIVYGAQGFDVGSLWQAVERCKSIGATVAVSLPWSRRSGSDVAQIEIPDGLFAVDVRIKAGGSMLRRLQKQGESVSDDQVTERLLVT